jgi:transposase
VAILASELTDGEVFTERLAASGFERVPSDRSHSGWIAHTPSRHPRDLADEHWEILQPVLPVPTRRVDGRGSPWKETRAVLNGILWVLRTSAPWAYLPNRYPSYQTCHRRFRQWVRCGVLKDVLAVLAQALYDEGYLDLREAFIDGSFASAKQGGDCVGKTKRGKGSKIMAIADRQGFPIAVHVESATRRTFSECYTWLAGSSCCVCL